VGHVTRVAEAKLRRVEFFPTSRSGRHSIRPRPLWCRETPRQQLGPIRRYHGGWFRGCLTSVAHCRFCHRPCRHYWRWAHFPVPERAAPDMTGPGRPSRRSHPEATACSLSRRRALVPPHGRALGEDARDQVARLIVHGADDRRLLQALGVAYSWALLFWKCLRTGACTDPRSPAPFLPESPSNLRRRQYGGGDRPDAASRSCGFALEGQRNMSRADG
jgi:hypothetical protein